MNEKCTRGALQGVVYHPSYNQLMACIEGKLCCDLAKDPIYLVPVIADAFPHQVEFERPRQVAGGRSQLALLERTTESQDLGSRARTHPTSHIYV